LAKLRFRKQEWEIKDGVRLRDAIQQIGLNPQSVLAVKDGKLLTEDVVLREEDEIQLISVISGG
jgi:sulfur carrier protein